MYRQNRPIPGTGRDEAICPNATREIESHCEAKLIARSVTCDAAATRKNPPKKLWCQIMFDLSLRLRTRARDRWYRILSSPPAYNPVETYHFPSLPFRFCRQGNGWISFVSFADLFPNDRSGCNIVSIDPLECSFKWQMVVSCQVFPFLSLRLSLSTIPLCVTVMITYQFWRIVSGSTVPAIVRSQRCQNVPISLAISVRTKPPSNRFRFDFSVQTLSTAANCRCKNTQIHTLVARFSSGWSLLIRLSDSIECVLNGLTHILCARCLFSQARCLMSSIFRPGRKNEWRSLAHYDKWRWTCSSLAQWCIHLPQSVREPAKAKVVRA